MCSFFVLKMLYLEMFYQSVFHHCDKIPEIINLKGGKGLFCFMVSEVSVHNHLALLFWAWGSTKETYLIYGNWTAKTDRKRPRSQYLLQGHIVSNLTSSLYSHLLKVPSPHSANLRTKPFWTHGLLGSFPIPTIANIYYSIYT